jgi:LmbE family N-acetylglucosaminyl deacetylase
MPEHFLVLFVADAAHDDHAHALRGVARAVPEAGFFDDPEGGEQRTVGTYVRARELQDGLELLRAVAVLSRAQELRFEVQHGERIVGFLEAGTPDAGLRAELGPLGDIPDPF